MNRKFFYDMQHASQYLRGSVIRVAGDPVMVNDMVPRGREDRSPDIVMDYTKLGTRNRARISLADQTINYKPVPLGFANYNCRHSGLKYSVYCSRIPARVWKVGLCRNNFYTKDVLCDNQGAYGTDRYYLLVSKELGNTISSVFPKFNECLDLMGEDPDAYLSIAFSRRFSILPNGRLRYKDMEYDVGKWDEKGPVLFDDFKYLENVLKEDMQ